MRTEEEIKKDWEKVVFLKKICYGHGPAPKHSDCYRDMKRLEKEYSMLIKSKISSHSSS